jgi:hypothetical protein
MSQQLSFTLAESQILIHSADALARAAAAAELAAGANTSAQSHHFFTLTGSELRAPVLRMVVERECRWCVA